MQFTNLCLNYEFLFSTAFVAAHCHTVDNNLDIGKNELAFYWPAEASAGNMRDLC